MEQVVVIEKDFKKTHAFKEYIANTFNFILEVLRNMKKYYPLEDVLIKALAALNPLNRQQFKGCQNLISHFQGIISRPEEGLRISLQ
jgi:hypothetical protein